MQSTNIFGLRAKTNFHQMAAILHPLNRQPTLTPGPNPTLKSGVNFLFAKMTEKR